MKIVFTVILMTILLTACASNSGNEELLSKHELELESLRTVIKEKDEELLSYNEQIAVMTEELGSISNENLELSLQLENTLSDLEEKIILLNDYEEDKSNDVSSYLIILNETLEVTEDDPDERLWYVGEIVIDTNYSIDSALSSSSFGARILSEFDEYLELSSEYLTDDEYDDIKSSATRFNGYPSPPEGYNNETDVKTTLFDQKYIIKYLDFALAIEEYRNNLISVEVLEEKKEQYLDFRDEYQIFINSMYGLD